MKVSISVITPSIDEPSIIPGVFRFIRTGGNMNESISISYALITSGPHLASPGDYTIGPIPQITFNEGGWFVEVNVFALEDTEMEADEFIYIGTTSTSVFEAIDTAPAQMRIAANDMDTSLSFTDDGLLSLFLLNQTSEPSGPLAHFYQMQAFEVETTLPQDMEDYGQFQLLVQTTKGSLSSSLEGEALSSLTIPLSGPSQTSTFFLKPDGEGSHNITATLVRSNDPYLQQPAPPKDESQVTGDVTFENVGHNIGQMLTNSFGSSAENRIGFVLDQQVDSALFSPVRQLAITARDMIPPGQSNRDELVAEYDQFVTNLDVWKAMVVGEMKGAVLQGLKPAMSYLLPYSYDPPGVPLPSVYEVIQGGTHVIAIDAEENVTLSFSALGVQGLFNNGIQGLIDGIQTGDGSAALSALENKLKDPSLYCQELSISVNMQNAPGESVLTRFGVRTPFAPLTQGTATVYLKQEFEMMNRGRRLKFNGEIDWTLQESPTYIIGLELRQ